MKSNSERIGILLGGPEGEQPLSIDLEHLMAGRLLLTGNSGAGKSSALRLMAEACFGLLQIVVVDPEGEYYTLREKFDFLLVGGESADCPTGDPVALAETLIKLNASAIVSLDELESTEEAPEFVGAFLNSLFSMPADKRRPLLLLIDEADVWAPERGATPALAPLANICKRGRKRGLIPVLATQNPAALSKACSSAMINKLIGRQSQDIHVARGLADLGKSRRHADEMRRLTAGQFYGVGPAFGLNSEVGMIQLDQPRTKHLRPGMMAPPKAPPSKEVAKILQSLIVSQQSTSAKPVEKTVDQGRSMDDESLGPDSKKPNSKIRNSESSTDGAPRSPITRDDVTRARAEGLDTGRREALAQSAERLRILYQSINMHIVEIMAFMSGSSSAAVPAVTGFEMTPGERLGTQRVDFTLNGDFPPGAKLERIKPALDLAAMLRPVHWGLLAAVCDRPEGLTRDQARKMAGYARSGDVSCAWADLVKWGLTVKDGGLRRPTQLGSKQIASLPQAPGVPRLKPISKALANLKPLEQKLLEAARKGPGTRAELADRAGYRMSGDVSVALAKFNRMGLLERVDDKLQLAK